MSKLKKEYRLLDSALAYWNDEALHFTLKDWYDKLKKQEENENGKKI